MATSGDRPASAPGTSSSTSTTRHRGKLASRPIRCSYALADLIGKGGYGSVYRARHLSSGETVAVKVVELFRAEAEAEAEASTSEPAAKQKLGELEAMAILGQHDSLLELREAFVEAGKLFLVTDLMDGDLCDTLLDSGSGFSESESRRCFYQILLGLAHMHRQGVIHRDVKLDNVMLRNKDDISTVCIGDFGLAHVPRRGAARGSVGSLQYMAPEVVRSSVKDKTQSYGPSSDMWSAGVLLYTLLVKRFPFSGRSKAELKDNICSARYEFDGDEWSGISLNAKDIIQQMLSLEPSQRLSAEAALQHPWFDDVKPRPHSAKSEGWVKELLKRSGLGTASELRSNKKAKASAPKSPQQKLHNLGSRFGFFQVVNVEG